MNTTPDTPATGTDAPGSEPTPISAAKGTGSKRAAARQPGASRQRQTAAQRKQAANVATAKDKAKATPKPKTTRKPKPEVPAGWEAWLAHRTYMIRRTGDVPEGGSKLGVMCRAHGTIYPKPVASITEGDKIGAKPNRPSWCRKCKAEQAAKAGS
jgi:hypothetical protein